MKRSVLGIFLVSCLLLLRAEQLTAKSPPTLGEGYYTAGSTPTPGQVAGAPAMGAQDPAMSATGPVCTSDAACQQLCPTADFSKAAPPLPLSTVQHQVQQPAMALAHSLTLGAQSAVHAIDALFCGPPCDNGLRAAGALCKRDADLTQLLCSRLQRHLQLRRLPGRRHIPAALAACC